MGPFPDKETEGALNGLDDGVFFVRKINKIDEKYEICLKYIHIFFWKLSITCNLQVEATNSTYCNIYASVH